MEEEYDYYVMTVYEIIIMIITLEIVFLVCLTDMEWCEQSKEHRCPVHRQTRENIRC